MILVRRSPEERASELIDALANAIYEHENSDGTTGMPYKEWRRFAEQEVAQVLREVRLSEAAREAVSTRVLTAKLTKATWLILAATFSFISFWGGVVYVGQTFGLWWGLACAASAAILAAAFSLAAMID